MRRLSLISFSLLSILSAFFIIKSTSRPTKQLETISRADKSKQVKLSKRDRMDLAMAQEFEMTKDPALGRVPRERLYKAFEYAQKKRQRLSLRKTSTAISNVNWTERGPINFGGRTRAIMIDPTDATHKSVFAAGVSGGLWHTTDITVSSPTWTAVNDFFENLAITTLAYDPSDTQIMYFGTGEGWYNVDAVQGDGVFKSTDGGSNWTQLSSTAGNSTFRFIQKIVVHPTTGAIYVATRDNGVQRSTDGGSTWTTVLSGGGNGSSDYAAADLEIGADNSIYAAMGIFSTDGVYKSSTGNNGSWTMLNTGSNGFPTSGFERIELACAPSDANVLYAFTQDASNTQIYHIYRSADGGSNWSTVTNPSSADPNHSDYTNGQAWYDLIAAVDPNDANTLFTGGIDLYKSTDGGSNWTQISHWYGGYGYQEVHADQHAIVFQEGSSSVIYFGNDGGIYRTTDGTAGTPTLTHKNTGYNTIQFYSCAIHPDAGSNHFLAGAQDNGSHRFSSIGLNSTVEVTGGDGAFCHIDQDEADYQFTAYVYNQFRRSTDGGQSFSSVDFSSTAGRFINPTDYDNSANKLYSAWDAGYYMVWQDPQSGTSYSTVSVGAFNGRILSAITVSPNVSNRVYFGTDQGVIVRVDDAASAPSGGQINSGAGMPAAYITCIEVENGNENHILVTYSNYGTNSVWETTDGGSNWHSVEGNLPDMPVRWALFNPDNSDQALLATELGVWSTDNLNGSSTDWDPSNTGLANVRTDMLQIRSADKVMIAATHGRGLFSSDVFAAVSADFTVDKTLAYQQNTLQFTDGSTGATSWSWNFGDGTTSTLQNPTHSYSSSGKYTVTLTINGGEDTKTKTDYIHILPNRGTPYLAADGGNFETNVNDFGSGIITGSINIWERGTPSNAITTLNSQSNGWKTDLDADVTTGDYSCALYSPSFNLSKAGTYSLQFYKSMEVAYSNAPFGVYVEYSVDQGENWSQLGSYNDGNGTNWYERDAHDVTPNGDAFCSNFTNQFTAYDISSLSGNAQVCFRIIFIIETGWSGGYDQDGFMVDDFAITGETNDASLPVELSTFTVTALPHNNSIRVDWRTESEVNNAYWLIERKEHNGAFATIKKLKGQGSQSNATEYSFEDTGLESGTEYTYRLLDVALDGTVTNNGERTVLLRSVPVEFNLAQNYPNPFNPATVINYQIAAPGHVTLTVYNALGQKVQTLVNEKRTPGSYSATFNASGLASGIYYYTLKSGKSVSTQRMVLLR